MGCSAPLTFGPFSDPTGTFMQDLLGVHPRAVIEQITMIRCGRSANIELFEYDAPDQRRTFPKNSDWAGHHIAFYVTDIDAAVAYMQSKGVEKLLGPLAVTDGPRCRAVDQLLPRAVRHLHRADQLPQGHGLREDGRDAALGSARQQALARRGRPELGRYAFSMTEKVQKTEQEWQTELTPEQYRVLREHGTERAFTGEYYATKDPGVYFCAGCGAELFRSETKYDSGTGWPSFYAPADGEAVETDRDWKLLVPRTEVHCAACGGHLAMSSATGRRRPGCATASTRPRSSSSARKESLSDREGGVRRRVLLGRRGGLPQRSGRQGRGRRLHGRRRAQPDLRAGLHGRHRPRRGRRVEFDPTRSRTRRSSARSGTRTTPRSSTARAPTSGASTARRSSSTRRSSRSRRSRPRPRHRRAIRRPSSRRSSRPGVLAPEDYHQQYLVKRGRASCLI